MSNYQQKVLLDEAEKNIDQCTASLTDLAHAFRLKPLENDFQDQAFDILMDAYRERIVPFIEHMQRERDFLASGEAAAENKEEVNRNWYLEIMQNSEFKDE